MILILVYLSSVNYFLGWAGEHEIVRTKRVGVGWCFDIFNDLQGGGKRPDGEKSILV